MMQRKMPYYRRGAAIVAAVVLLAVVVVTLGVAMRQVASSQQRTREQRWALQATYLAESAFDRARGQLARNQEYRGETWKPEVSGPGSVAEQGSITIEIQPQAGEEAFHCHVTAMFPDQPVHRAQVQISRQLTVRTNND